MSLLLKHITYEKILKKLVSLRCDCAEKYQKEFVVDSLNGGQKKFSIKKENSILYEIFPSRRQWVHICAKRRIYQQSIAGVLKTNRLTQKEKNEQNLLLTVYREAKKKEHGLWYTKLEKYIQHIIDLSNDRHFVFSTPRTFGVEKKRDIIKREIEVRPICQFCTIEERIIASLYNNALTELFDDYFYKHSYAFRLPAKKGSEPALPHLKAIQTIRKYRKANSGVVWVAECDMKKFYDTIDHNIIKQCFKLLLHQCKKDGRITKEEYNQLTHVMYSYIECYSFYQNIYIHNGHPEDDFWRCVRAEGFKKEVKWVEEDIKRECALLNPYPGKNYYKNHLGVPQGGALSGLIANIVMHYVDNKLRSYCKKEDFLYVRFCDDMIMMCPEHDRLTKAFEIYKTAVKNFHLYIHDDTPMTFSHMRDFWKGKTRAPYPWGGIKGKDIMPWITFVGFDINWNGDTRIRRSTYQKEIKKQYDKCQEIISKLSDKSLSPLRHRSFILSSITKRLIGMSVGRVPLWDYRDFDNKMSWASAFTELSSNQYSRRQLKNLDNHRNKMMAKLNLFLSDLDYRKSKVTSEDADQPIYHIYYGKPFSYYGQVLKLFK